MASSGYSTTDLTHASNEIFIYVLSSACCLELSIAGKMLNSGT